MFRRTRLAYPARYERDARSLAQASRRDENVIANELEAGAEPPDPDEHPIDGHSFAPKAAAAGNTKAMFALGCCYADGQGVAQDPLEAVRWLRSAVDSEDPWVRTNATRRLDAILRQHPDLASEA